jgi:hypothetical protein
MLILIPWKPLAMVWGLLSGLLFFGFIVSSLMEGKDPFDPHLRHAHYIVRQSAMHSGEPHKLIHKTSTATNH